MRLSWGQTVAGGLTLAVVAGLMVLPGRLLGPDRPVELAIPPAPAALPAVQAVAPLAIRRLRPARPSTHTVAPRTPQSSYVPTARTARTVAHVSPARRLLKAHRSAVISKLAPTAPLVRARVLAAVSAQHPVVKPKPKAASSTAKTIATLAAQLSKR